MNRVLFIGTLGLVLGGTPASVSAFCRSTTCVKACEVDPVTTCVIEGEPIAWLGSCLGYTVYRDGLPSISQAELSQATDAAFRAWQTATCPTTNKPPSISVGDFFGVAACGRVEYNSRQANANVIVMRESWDKDKTALAITTVTMNNVTGEIYDVDMEINGTQALSVGPPTPNRFDLQSIITHEAGHFLGIAHSNQDGATMFPTYQSGVEDFRTLENDDIAAICTVYPPERNVAACDPTPRRGFSPECGLDPMTGGGCSLASAPERSSPGAMAAFFLGCSVAVRRLGRPRQRAQKLT